MNKFAPNAETYAKHVVKTDCPGADWVNIAEDYTRGYAAGLEEAAHYLETASTTLYHGTGWAVLVRRLIPLGAEPEAQRCKHGVHGADCVECFPTLPLGDGLKENG